jgi:Peptidase MA superfamily
MMKGPSACPQARFGASRRFALGTALTLVLAVVLVGLAAVAPRSAHADSIDVTNLAERAPDPTQVTFTARVRAPAGVKSARLIYKVRNPDGDVGGEGEATVSPGAETDVTFTLTTNGGDNQRYIPVGSTFRYHWDIEDSTGSKVSSAEKDFVFLDGRYQWRTFTEGADPPVTVYWYGNNQDRATNTLAATRASLKKVGELLQTTVPYPVKVVVWASEPDGELAQRSRGGSFDQTVLTGGTRVAPDLILVFVPDVDIVQHEVGHIVTHVAGDGPFGSLPSWIDEGTAVWAQSGPGGGYSQAVELAVRSNQPLNLRSMQANTNRPDEVNLFYGQSFSTVDYLVKTHGAAKYAELFKVFNAGASMDTALQQVYGFDQNGLYNAWRASKGLPAIAFATPVAGNFAVPEATRAPLGFPTSVAGTSGSAPQPSTGGAASTPSAADPVPTASSAGLPAAGLAVLGGTVALALVLAGGAIVILRKRPSTAG